MKVGLCGRYNLSDMSRMNREIHVRICEGLGVKFPWSTRLFCFRGKQKLYLYRANEFAKLCGARAFLAGSTTLIVIIIVQFLGKIDDHQK